jgi:hypothetical protein
MLRDQRRMAKWVLGRERNSSNANMSSMDADKHRLSDQVGQLQSKLDRAALHRDLMELQKKTLERVVTRTVKSCTNSRRTRRHLTKDAFESLARTSSSGVDRMERTACGFSGASPSRLQLMQRFKHS